ncbi:lipopolysaccharide biosynthesis protein [Flavobacterium sp. ZS1P14]|uniref:lipopolysaccharide biosynthesis protein n=1 Tax=Flavobacterium sp. ZS1P14 TaxID=3401729 RepID=UPI003AAA2395
MKRAISSKKKMSIINLVVNYSNTFFLILNGLVLVPIYFEYFSLSIYGSYLAAANIAGILGLLEFGLSLVFTQKLSVLYKNKNYGGFSKLMGAGLIASFILVSILMILSFAISPFVPEWVKASPKDYLDIKHAFIINSLGIGLNIYSNTITSIFQAWSRVQISGIINVASAFFGIIGTIVSLYFGFGVMSISVGILIKSLVCVVSLLPFLIINYKKDNYPKFKIEINLIYGILKDSLPVFGNTVSKSLIDNGQLLIITNFINPTATAIYSLTSKVFQVCNNLLAPIGSSIFSSLSQLVGENNSTHLKSNVLKIFSLFTLFSILILATSFALNNSFVIMWVGADKYGGTLLSLMLCLNLFVSSRFSYINFNLFALGIFGKTVLFDQIGALMRLLLIFFLIKFLGVISIPVSELIATIFSGFFLNRLFIRKMGFDNKEKNIVLFFGFFEFILLIILAIFYQNFFLMKEDWFRFLLHCLGIFLIISTCLIYFNSDLFLNYLPRLAKIKNRIFKT